MRRAVAASAGLVAGVLLVHGDTLADDAGAAARRTKAVATVGNGPGSRVITIGDLEDRLASMPSFQRSTFGASAGDIRRRVLDEVLVREGLLSLGAQASGLETQPAVARALDRAVSSSAVRAIRASLGPAADIPMSDVRAYYERNRARYDAPAQYQVWRILCKTSDEAGVVLAAAQADATPKTFAQLARDHSQDKATALRSGNLGFLAADGTSSEPGLRVDPAIVRAVQAVRDGDFVPSPVVEGDFFSVVWRRGSIVARSRAVEEVAEPIREILSRERVKTTVDALVASLRSAKVRDVHEELLEAVDLSTLSGASRAP